VKRLWLVFLFILPGTFLFAQDEYTIKRIIFLPPTFYVGDLVELRVTLEAAPGKTIKQPSGMPELSWIRFDDMSMKIEGQEAELRIRFSTFFPGTRALPDLQLGDILLSGVKIHTDSVVTPENNTLAPPRQQLLLPGTMFYLIAFLALVIILPVVIIPLFRRFRSSLLSSLHRQREGRLYRRFQKDINNMENQVDSMDSRAFYIRLTEGLRHYLSGRTGRDFITTTSREIRIHLKKTFKDTALNNLITALFKSGDVVKFSGSSVRKKKKLQDLSNALQAAARIEEYLSEEKHVDS